MHIYMCCAVLSRFRCVHLCVTPWTAGRQAPLSMGFSRQEYWSGTHTEDGGGTEGARSGWPTGQHKKQQLQRDGDAVKS